MIQRPTLIPVPSYLDSRGHSFFDIFRAPVMQGQINLGTIFPEIVKAFHYHRLQDDNWFCVSGNIHVVCATPKDEALVTSNDENDFHIDHFYIGENKPALLRIPALVWHGYRSLGQRDATLLYWVTNTYRPGEEDEYRKAWDIFGKELWMSKNE